LLGTTLSHFRITAALGQGGMGEVYRATDTRLDREVAVKVLPEELAADPERLARFDREAKILAALDHPNIASIWGLEEAGGRQLLVMQLAEGETLAERIERGPLPLSKVLAIALQVTDALESAHEQGIIHRDLKPANVMVNPDGQVKLLDFGLARAIEADSGIEPTDTEQVLTQSPTVSQPMTNAGTLLGTAAYMSPEQARGEAADERADIWSFGCLLFEMLTGHLLFAGPTMSDILAAILRQEPDWDSLPSSCPPALRRLLSRCLAKEKSQRLRHIADARLELLDASRRPAEAAPPTDTHKRIPARVMVIALMLAAAVAGAGIYSQVARLAAPGAGTGPAAMPRFRAISFDRGYVHSAHFTPDGTTVLYGAAFKGEPVRVYSTRTDGTALQSRLLEWPSADVAGISDTGDVALLLDRHHVGSWLRVGSLAQVPLSGGSPRIIQNEVYAADISPDGSEFAIVTATATEQQLEFPIGSVVFRTTGWISHPRISPDGSRVAFLDHPFWGDDIGYVALARAGGDAERLEPTLHNGLQGVAWSPSGEEVWYTSGSPSALWSIRPGEPPRVLHRSPSAVRIQDTAPSGEYLVTNDPSRAELAGRLAGDEEDRLYSWWGEDTAGGIAEDGSVFAGANSYQQLNRE
jgi:hypothetical protein